MSDQQANETLMLYMDELCGFCHMVRNTIGKLGLEVEMRDIRSNKEWANELREARGRMTVPVLRRVSADGESDWMPESRDIMAYLESTYG